MQTTVKYWPTPQVFDFSNEDTVPLLQFKAFIDKATISIPQSEIQSATINGVSGLSISYDHTLTDAEYFSHTLGEVRRIIHQHGQHGLNREAVEELLRIIGA